MKLPYLLYLKEECKKKELTTISRKRTIKNSNVIDWIAVILLIIGGLDIGFMGVFDYNILTPRIFGQLTALLRSI